MYFHVYLIYRFTRTFTDHSSVITRCWGFELQNGKSSLKSPQTLATQDFAPASFLSTPDTKRPLFSRKVVFSFAICNNFEQFKFPLLRLTTHLATDRKKSDLRGCFAPEAHLFNLPDLLYLAALSPWRSPPSLPG